MSRLYLSTAGATRAKIVALTQEDGATSQDQQSYTAKFEVTASEFAFVILWQQCRNTNDVVS